MPRNVPFGVYNVVCDEPLPCCLGCKFSRNIFAQAAVGVGAFVGKKVTLCAEAKSDNDFLFDLTSHDIPHGSGLSTHKM